jgi:peptide/nickel transport system substrate-binding protein
VSRRRIVPLLALLIVSLSCSRERPVSRTTAAAPAVESTDPEEGGTLVRRLDTDIVTLNPVLATSKYDRYLNFYLFTPLVYLDQNLRPIPGLATSWDISPDGLRYTFRLNEKATYSDGTPVRASDVLFTLRHIMDPQAEAVQTASSFEFLDFAKSRAVDAHTVELVFRERLAMQLLRFCEVYVMPEHVYGKGDFKKDYNDTAVGSGPYKLVRRIENNEVVIARREDFWDRKPYLHNVVFKVIGDAATGWNAMKRGDVDESMVQSDLWVRERTNPQLQKTIDFQRFYTLNYNYIGWNNRHPLLSDKRVRRALAMCIPMESVINDLYHGTARAMTGPFTPDEWAYNPRVPAIRHDPEGAKRILASMGWLDRDGDGVLERDGKPFRFSMIVTSGGGTTAQFTQFLQSELKKIGVRMDIAVIEGNVAIQRILSGNFEATYLGWDLDPDPDPYALFHSSQTPPRGQNFVYYANAEADRLMETARRELDLDKREELYHRLHEVLAEDQPYAWTIQVSIKWALNTRLRGVKVSPGYGLYLWYPGVFDWWIPNNLRTHDRPAAAR